MKKRIMIGLISLLVAFAITFGVWQWKILYAYIKYSNAQFMTIAILATSIVAILYYLCWFVASKNKSGEYETKNVKHMLINDGMVIIFSLIPIVLDIFYLKGNMLDCLGLACGLNIGLNVVALVLAYFFGNPTRQ